MSAQRDGGAAFPGKTSPKASDARQIRDELGIGLYDAKELLSYGGGMSLRDWFAGQALAGLCGALGKVSPKTGESQSAADARWSYERADAMLAAREVWS